MKRSFNWFTGYIFVFTTLEMNCNEEMICRKRDLGKTREPRFTTNCQIEFQSNKGSKTVSFFDLFGSPLSVVAISFF